MPASSLLCVTIGRGRHRALIAEHKHLAEQGCKLVELRLDFLMTPPNLKRLLAARPCPVVVTCRREKDGGRWTKSEESRLMLLRQAIAAGVEYVDLEEDIAASIPRFGDTKRIISYHNFRETPEDLSALHARLSGLNADIVKIATMAHGPHDNVRLLRLMRTARIPTIAICMGEFGQPSRILAGKFGAPFTYATFHAERSMAPGQLSYQQMREVYHYEDINTDTDVYGVIADPVAHSLSPVIHNAAFNELRLNKIYVPLRVPREELSQFMHDARELGIKGLSVTIPHKEEICQKHLDKCDDSTHEIGACNTVLLKENRTYGYNTDYAAAMASLDHMFGGDEGASGLRGKTVLLLGAGGVARAIGVGLKRRDTDIIIASRTMERTEELARILKAKAIAWGQRHGVKPHLIVNCTPIGMHPNVDESPIEARYLQSGIVVFDTVYNPEQTLLIKQARDCECTYITGIDMFVSQASIQFKHFTGQEAPVDLMRRVVKQAISPVKVQ
ncbi:MAG: shikimate dehydrogenase [Planctomycetaceae bacterium]|nr:shikimate dehydrogenase [Planctomycetaceae bacterium]